MLQPSHIFTVAAVFRAALLEVGEWQDSNLEVKFTDVDYFVFDDSAKFVALGESPYKRATYRYSPILAWLLIPNNYHKSWGKWMFVGCDLLAALLMKKVLDRRKVPQNLSNLALIVWLFNPLTAAVSCRGNAESLLSAILIGVVHALQLKLSLVAGILFALSVHLKIYPIVYSLALFLYLGGSYDDNNGIVSAGNVISHLRGFKFAKLSRILFSKERLKFLCSSLLTMVLLTAIMYRAYGFDFLEHTYLYHITRRDIRHNFSTYFYMLYINPNPLLSLLCFIYQVVIVTALSISLYDDLPFSMFLITFAFVSFNKICTSQYFLWYLTYLPLVLPGISHISLKTHLFLVFLWLTGQALWLFPAYCLEFLGLNTFIYLWLASLIFFIINVYIICWFIKNYKKPNISKKQF